MILFFSTLFLLFSSSFFLFPHFLLSFPLTLFLLHNFLSLSFSLQLFSFGFFLFVIFSSFGPLLPISAVFTLLSFQSFGNLSACVEFNFSAVPFLFSFQLLVFHHPTALQSSIVGVVPSLLVKLLPEDDLVGTVAVSAGDGVDLEVVDHLLAHLLVPGQGRHLVHAVQAEVARVRVSSQPQQRRHPVGDVDQPPAHHASPANVGVKYHIISDISFSLVAS